jgi:hypothetical protein
MAMSALGGNMRTVQTYAQATAGPDETTREITRRLADLAKVDGPRFAAVVRQADAAIAAGTGRDEALRAALDGTLAG